MNHSRGHSRRQRHKVSCDLGDLETRDEVGADQVAYYRARAPWYDDAYTSRGDYDQGPTLNAQWRADLAAIEALMSRANLRGDCVELGAGTGYWTERLVDRADRVWAVDAVAEVLTAARERLGERAAKVQFDVVDLWRWNPERIWDCAVACFFFEHVPDEVLPGLLQTLHASLRPGGPVFLAEGAAVEAEPQVETREIGGRTFRVVERRRSGDELTEAFAAAGFTVEIAHVSQYVCLTGMRN